MTFSYTHFVPSQFSDILQSIGYKIQIINVHKLNNIKNKLILEYNAQTVLIKIVIKNRQKMNN